MKIKVSFNVILCILFVGFIFQSPIAQHTTGIVRTIANNLDEMFAVAVFAYSVVKLRFNKTQANFIAFQAVFLLIGLLGTVIYNIQTTRAVFQDVVNCSKFAATIVGIITIYRSDDCEKIFSMLKKVTMVLTGLLFIMAVVDYIFRPSFFEHTFSYYTLQLFYYHPAIMAQVMVLFLAILGYGESDKLNIAARILCLVMLCATLRAKAIAFAIIYLFIWNYKFLTHHRVLRVMSVIVMIAGIVYMTRDSFNMYYGSLDSSARGTMTMGGFDVANRYFPLGAGFGTYGTSAAVNYYSPLYVELGFKKVYGLGYANTNYATDTFWPAIFGEFGYIGVLVFIGFVWNMIVPCYHMIKHNSSVVVLYTSILAYLLVCTTSGTGFFNPIAVPYAVIMGICLCKFSNEKQSKKVEEKSFFAGYKRET